MRTRRTWGRLLAALAVALVAAVGFAPRAAWAAESLPEAVDGVVTLTEDTSFDALPDYEGELIIDMGGHTLTYTGSAPLLVDNGDSLSLKSGTFRANAISGPTVATFNVLTDSSISLESVTMITNGAALFPQGDAASVTVVDSAIYAPVYAVATNAATDGNYGVVITLANSQFINAMSDDGDGCPVMINVPGTLDMTDCTVVGTRQAVLVRGGTANIAGCEIKLAATNDGSVTLPVGVTGSRLFQVGENNNYLGGNWASGNEVPNYALVVGNRSSSYPYPTNASLENTTVTAPSGSAAYIYGMEEEGREVSLVYDEATEFSSDPVAPLNSSAVYGPAVAEVDGLKYASLQMALDVADDGDVVTLVGDATDGDTQAVITDKNISLDLNGFTLTLTTAWTPITVNGASAGLTIYDSSSEGNGRIVSTNADPVIQVTQGKLDFQSGTIEVWDSWLSTGPNGEQSLFGADAIRIYGSSDENAKNYSVVHVGSDAVIKNSTETAQGDPIGNGYGIDVNYAKGTEPHAYGVVVEFEGSTSNSGMYINGSIADTTGNVPNITLADGAEINGMIYAAGYAVWDIEGASITADTGIEIRAGKLNMTAGSIVGTGTPTDVLPNGNGSTTSGAGIAVSQHTTKLPITVKISGGEVSGYTALYESTPQENSDSSVISLEVTGGTFTATNGGVNAVYSQNKTGFISGGTFSSAPADNLIVAGSESFQRADGTFGVAEEDKIFTVTIDGEKQLCAEGTLAVKPADPVRAGYTFKGWQTADGKAYDFTAPVTGDLTLTAAWQLDAPEVTLAANVEKPVEGDEVTLTATVEHPALSGLALSYAWYLDGEAIPGATGGSLKVTEPGSYTVEVSARDASGNVASATSPALELSFAPAPKPGQETVTLTFMYGSEVYATVKVPANEPVPADRIPEDPTLEGYTFVGWYAELAEDGKTVVPDSKVDLEKDAFGSDVTLHAGFVPVGADEGTTPQKPGTKPAGEKEDGLAQTGDIVSLVPAVVAGAAGLTAAAGALTLRRRSK